MNLEDDHDTDLEISLRVERIRDLSERLVSAKSDLAATAKRLDSTQRDLDSTRRALARARGRRLVRVGDWLHRRAISLVAIADLIRVSVSGSRSVIDSGRPGGPETQAVRAESAGPDGFRALFMRQLTDTGLRVDGALRVAIIGGTTDGARSTDDLGSQAFRTRLHAFGWQIVEAVAGPGRTAALRGVGLLISSDAGFDVRHLPDGVVKIAWVDGSVVEEWLTRPWFDEYDLVFTSDDVARIRVDERSVHLGLVHHAHDAASRADAIRARLVDWAQAPWIDLAIGPVSWKSAGWWGDYHFGRALQRSLQRRGYPTRLRLRSEWDGPAADRADVVVHLFGVAERTPRHGQVNVLWIISHPDLVTDEMIGAQDAVFVASDEFAEVLAARTGRNIEVLHQATDTSRFRPAAGGPAHDLLFVAGNRRARRPVIDELTPTRHDLAVYGHNWTPDYLDPRYLRGAYIPNDELGAYYAAAGIVLNDHWTEMADHGFFSNRLYDAAASGAFVISDRVAGMDEEFDGGIVGFDSGAELRRLVDHYLVAPEERAALARRAYAAVTARHTFGHRVDAMLPVILPLIADRFPGRRIPVGATSEPRSQL